MIVNSFDKMMICDTNPYACFAWGDGEEQEAKLPPFCDPTRIESMRELGQSLHLLPNVCCMRITSNKYPVN